MSSMRDSLRAKLLVWYTVILAVVIVGFAGAVCHLYWRSALRELDTNLAAEARAIARALRPVATGEFDLDLAADPARDADKPRFRTYHIVWGPGGELIDASATYDGDTRPPGAPSARTRAARREIAVSTADGAIVLVGRPIADLQADVLSLATIVGGAGLLALGLSLLGGWFLVGRALAPMARISAAARAMSGGDLTACIAVERTESELGQLASLLNDAFDRLRLAVAAQRRFTADASHELRTPLATMSAELEWALSRDRDATDYRSTLATCQRAVVRMHNLVEGLLTLAHADSAELQLRRERVCLVPLVEDVLALLRPLAEQKGLTLGTHLEPAAVLGDAERLFELLINLLSNAIQYNCEGGRIQVDTGQDSALVYIRVADTGMGIRAEDVPRIFDRFYRGDEARVRKGGGAGLGLAIVKSIAEAHGGTVTCESTSVQGTNFVVCLPAAARVGRDTIATASSETLLSGRLARPSLGRQDQGDPRAVADITLDLDLATVERGDALDDG